MLGKRWLSAVTLTALALGLCVHIALQTLSTVHVPDVGTTTTTTTTTFASTVPAIVEAVPPPPTPPLPPTPPADQPAQPPPLTNSSAYQCTLEEMVFSYSNYELVDSHICDSDHMWRLAQMLYPDMSTFLDVGANVGYVSARIFGLWSPGTGLNRRVLRRLIDQDVADKKRDSTSTLDTVCGDGAQDDLPLLCHKQCAFARSIHVVAFDGQTAHAVNTRRVVYQRFPHLRPNTTQHTHAAQVTAPYPASFVRPTFEYLNAALTATVPSDTTMGFFSKKNDESGRLTLVPPPSNNNTSATNGTAAALAPRAGELVIPVTTIDRFCARRGLRVVDVLKVDAEGGDIDVLNGAMDTLRHRGVKVHLSHLLLSGTTCPRPHQLTPPTSG